MTDRKHDGRTSDDLDLGDGFAHEAEAPKPGQPPHDLTAGAHEEIALSRDRERALDRHDVRWRLHRDHLAHQTHAAPSHDLDGGSETSLQRQYEERRTLWELQREAILRDHADRRSELRADGTTLSGRFSTADGTSGSRDDHASEIPSPENRTAEPFSNDKHEDASLSRAFANGSGDDADREPSPREADTPPVATREFTAVTASRGRGL